MRLAGIVVLVLGLSACGDFRQTAGGALEGEVAPAPDDWTQIAADDVVQMETRPEDPYSVNLWIAGEGANLYVFAGDNYTTWVEHMETNPDVRVRIGEAIYELRARQVHDADEFERFAQLWEAKYGNRPRNENVDETYLMKLEPR